MQKSRHAARELALNILYQVDVAGIPLDEAIQTVEENVAAEPAVFEFAEVLARGTLSNLDDIDRNMERLSVGWTPARQPAVDRNILRLAIFEISHVEVTPPIVAVNEAVELAKKYSTADSGKFVNGLLAAYLRELDMEPEQLRGETK
jgi:N utilization substance protein B